MNPEQDQFPWSWAAGGGGGWKLAVSQVLPRAANVRTQSGVHPVAVIQLSISGRIKEPQTANESSRRWPRELNALQLKKTPSPLIIHLFTQQTDTTAIIYDTLYCGILTYTQISYNVFSEFYCQFYLLFMSQYFLFLFSYNIYCDSPKHQDSDISDFRYSPRVFTTVPCLSISVIVFVC